MDNKLVADLNQAAVDGIRGAGATGQYIWLEANSWSGAWHFVSWSPCLGKRGGGGVRGANEYRSSLDPRRL